MPDTPIEEAAAKAVAGAEPVMLPITTADTQEPHSIYTRREKWIIVVMIAVAGLYSPLPANIYLPALPLMSVKFGKSIEALNQTVTAFAVAQGISPMLWGPLSDRYGRRPVFLICLLILIGSCIGLALCPTNAYWLLIVLRALQAGGCASTIALGMGVCGDISTPEERGGYVGCFNVGPMLSLCIGPAIGGLLAQNLGWRAIFWFLVIMAIVCFLLIWLLLPETLRAIAGNGSIPMTGIYRPVIRVVGPPRPKQDANPPAQVARKKTSINPFPILTYIDIDLCLVFVGVVHAVSYTVTATISSAFAEVYPWLSQTALGLAYLPFGLGMVLGSTFMGKLLDWDYRRIKRTLEDEEGVVDFPKEYARLRTIPAHLVVFACSVIAWGWCIESKVSIAAPLVIEVFVGWTTISIITTIVTLNVDVLEDRSSAVTACTNLVRCSMAALLVSLIKRATNRLGYGWTYVLLGGICLLMIPLMYVVIRIGPRMRRRREKKALEKAMR